MKRIYYELWYNWGSFSQFIEETAESEEWLMKKLRYIKAHHTEEYFSNITVIRVEQSIERFREPMPQI